MPDPQHNLICHRGQIRAAETAGERTVWIDVLNKESLTMTDPRTGETYERAITDEYLRQIVANFRDYYATLDERGADYRFPVQDSAQRGPHKDSGRRLGDLLDVRLNDGLQVKAGFLEATWPLVESGQISGFSVGVDAEYTDPQTGETYAPMLREMSSTNHPKVKEATTRNARLTASQADDLGLCAVEPQPPSREVFAMPQMNSSQIKKAAGKVPRSTDQIIESVAALSGTSSDAVRSHIDGDVESVDMNILDALARVLDVPQESLMRSGGTAEDNQSGDGSGGDSDAADESAEGDVEASDQPESDVEAMDGEGEGDKQKRQGLREIGQRLDKLESAIRALVDEVKAEQSDDQTGESPEGDGQGQQPGDMAASETVTQLKSQVDDLEGELQDAKRMAGLNTSETGAPGKSPEDTSPTFPTEEKALAYVKQEKGLSGSDAVKAAGELVQ